MTPPGMLRVVSLNEAEARRRRIAIGTFDGVHLGHRAVMAGASTVLTFEPHPMQIIRPEAAPRLLTTFEVKRDLIEGLGVEELVVIDFDQGFAHQSAEQFIRDVLIDRLNAEWVSVGDNFRFGQGARGDAEMLESQADFDTRVVPLVEVDGEPVSSTRIRGHVSEGQMEAAQRCLGAPFIFEGKVVAGDRRGRDLGFPTANLIPDPRYVVPANGVYAAFANGRPAAVNVGTRPTFSDEDSVTIEAYLLDFEGDLYGQTLRIAFASRLRDERRFDHVDELVEQMHDDVAATRRVCASVQR